MPALTPKVWPKFIQIQIVSNNLYESLYALDNDGKVWMYNPDNGWWETLSMMRKEK